MGVVSIVSIIDCVGSLIISGLTIWVFVNNVNDRDADTRIGNNFFPNFINLV